MSLGLFQVNGIRTIYLRWLNERFGSRFCEDGSVRHETREVGQRHIGPNVVCMTMKVNTIVRIFKIMNIISFDLKCLKPYKWEQTNYHWIVTGNQLILYKLLVTLFATVVEGDQKAPFSIASTPRCRGGHYSFPWIALLYPLCVPYIAER